MNENKLIVKMSDTCTGLTDEDLLSSLIFTNNIYSNKGYKESLENMGIVYDQLKKIKGTSIISLDSFIDDIQTHNGDIITELALKTYVRDEIGYDGAMEMDEYEFNMAWDERTFSLESEIYEWCGSEDSIAMISDFCNERGVSIYATPDSVSYEKITEELPWLDGASDKVTYIGHAQKVLFKELIPKEVEVIDYDDIRLIK